MAELTKEACKELFGGVEWEVFMAFIDPNDDAIIHLVGFNERPNVAEIEDRIRELREDEEFGLTDKPDYINSLIVRIFSFD